MPPSSAPLPAPLPPLTTAPPAAPRPAPSSAPIAPGLAIRIARSVPVSQSAGAVATRVTGAGASVRTTAGVTLGRATAGGTRAGDGETVAAACIAGRALGVGVTGMACACASGAGRSIHAVVRPVLSAVIPVRPTAIVASFQWFLSMAMSSVSRSDARYRAAIRQCGDDVLKIAPHDGQSRRDVDEGRRIHAVLHNDLASPGAGGRNHARPRGRVLDGP